MTTPFAATGFSRWCYTPRRSLPRVSLSLLGLLSMLALGGFFPSPVQAQQIVPPAITAIACAYNTSPPTITTNYFGLAQCDSTGHLLITPSNTSAAPLYVADAPYSYTALGCQQITSLSAAAPFASIPTGAKLATVTPEVQPVRYRDDGTAPTASIGPLLNPGLVWSYSGPLASIQFIQTAASATIDVCFYK